MTCDGRGPCASPHRPQIATQPLWEEGTRSKVPVQEGLQLIEQHSCRRLPCIPGQQFVGPPVTAKPRAASGPSDEWPPTRAHPAADSTTAAPAIIWNSSSSICTQGFRVQGVFHSALQPHGPGCCRHAFRPRPRWSHAGQRSVTGSTRTWASAAKGTTAMARADVGTAPIAWQSPSACSTAMRPKR